MLLYHPAFDIYHGSFRVLRLLDRMSGKALELERVRILDFYLLFPDLLPSMRFPNEYRKQKKLFTHPENAYRKLADPKRVFFRLEPYQMNSIRNLVAWGLVDGDLLRENKVKRTMQPLPPEIVGLIKPESPEVELVVNFLTGPLSDIDLYGKSGLKDRTDLFEYRYDPPFSNSSTTPSKDSK